MLTPGSTRTIDADALALMALVQPLDDTVKALVNPVVATVLETLG